MSLCNSCSIRPICFVAKQNDSVQSFAACSVDSCQYYSPANIALHSDKSFHEIQDRIDSIKRLKNSKKSQDNIGEHHICADCGVEKDNCKKCDRCGVWTCPDCATTTLNDELLCFQCYDVSNALTMEYTTEV